MRYIALLFLLSGCQFSCQLQTTHKCNIDAGMCQPNHQDMNNNKISDEDLLLGIWFYNAMTSQ